MRNTGKKTSLPLSMWITNPQAGQDISPVFALVSSNGRCEDHSGAFYACGWPGIPAGKNTTLTVKLRAAEDLSWGEHTIWFYIYPGTVAQMLNDTTLAWNLIDDEPAITIQP
jgi:hypothetical protein